MPTLKNVHSDLLPHHIHALRQCNWSVSVILPDQVLKGHMTLIPCMS